MKYKGKKLSANVDFCVLPRPDGDVVIRCESVLDFEEFDEMRKSPEAPQRINAKKERIYVTEDPTYKLQLLAYQAERLTYLILKSIANNPDIEWEHVSLLDPATYCNYESEMKEAGFTKVELGRIQSTVFAVNALDEERLQAARDAFLLTTAEEAAITSGHPVVQ